MEWPSNISVRLVLVKKETIVDGQYFYIHDALFLSLSLSVSTHQCIFILQTHTTHCFDLNYVTTQTGGGGVT